MLIQSLSNKTFRVFLLGYGLILCQPLWANTVSCHADSAGEKIQKTFTAINDPLSISSVDFSNGFRFSGVLLEETNQFKSYVYYESKDRQVLIARQAVHQISDRCETSLGLNEVYAPYLENHLSFECVVTCEK